MDDNPVANNTGLSSFV